MAESVELNISETARNRADAIIRELSKVALNNSVKVTDPNRITEDVLDLAPGEHLPD